MRQWNFDHYRLELRRGDITQQPDMEAIVNAANAELRTGGGVAGAIHRAAGPELERECRPLAPIQAGEAVMTAAYNLANRYVIHCLGPVYGRDKPADRLLAQCYQRALELADGQGLHSIAFPAISTGAFGYPLNEAVPIALDSIRKYAASCSHLNQIALVLFSKEDWEKHHQYLTQK